MTLGWCPECGASYGAPFPVDALCPPCQRDDDALYANDPTPYVETDTNQWSRAGMRERLGVIGNVDE